MIRLLSLKPKLLLQEAGNILQILLRFVYNFFVENSRGNGYND